jgi:nucleotide sugar dehydrogenase
VETADPSIAAALTEAASAGRLFTTAVEDAYGLADVVVVDVDLGLDGDEVAMPRFEEAVRAIGRHVREDALVVVETTVPLGACRTVALPALREERARRGLTRDVCLGDAYERVMPGPRYLASVREYPRSYAGIDPESAARTRRFLESFVDAPLHELSDLESAETGKLLENSYRAANIAFIHEWTLLAESIGVDLWPVLESIRIRRGTHDNIRNPGFGVGGYCLTKDSRLAQWGAERLLGSDVRLEATLAALETNAQMPLHTFALLRDLFDGVLEGRTIVICGVAYLADVADTRNSPSLTLLEALERAGAGARVHDPCVRRWVERPDIEVMADLEQALAAADGIVLAVPHSAYSTVGGERLAQLVGGAARLVDTQNMLDDPGALFLHEHGWRVAGVGKGHWRAAGYGGSS